MKKFFKNDVSIKCPDKLESTKDVWFIHGFCESSEYFDAVFETESSKSFNIFTLDFPGFGESKYQEKYSGMIGSKNLLIELIKEFSEDREVYIIAHSMGGIIGALVCNEIGDKITKFICVEGILAEDPSRSSSKFIEGCEPAEFKENMLKSLSSIAATNSSFKRYLKKVELSDYRAIAEWASSSKKLACKNFIGGIYKNLKCVTLYLYGNNSFANADIEFIQSNKCASENLGACGHWPMIEIPSSFYATLYDALNVIQNNFQLN